MKNNIGKLLNTEKIKEAVSNVDLKEVTSKITDAKDAISKVAIETSNTITTKAKEFDPSTINFSTEDVITQVMKLPVVQVDREIFLRLFSVVFINFFYTI